ncbi:ABC transporter permease [Myxococcota bacterium]|nr:ABC transporter permease [Myxococcota bacterium]
MQVAWAIYKKELKVYFVSPLAYVFLGVFLLLAGAFFYLGVTMTGEASLRVMLGNLAIALLFLLPLLTMRHFAEERRAGTFELMMTAPVPLWAMLLGKWGATWTLCVALLAGTALFPAILAYYGEPDWGVIATSYLGLLLVCGAFVSAGMFSSSLTDEPVAAGMVGVVLLLPFWIAGTLAELVDAAWLRATLRHASFLTHIEPFSRGVVDTAALAWFGLFTFAFLFLTWRSIESRRWR